jgi:hypothetical protein
MVIIILLLGLIVGFVFRKKIQRWLESLEGPIGRLRNNRQEDQEDIMHNQNAYNYNNMQMGNPNIAYNDPNSSYRYAPPANYQANIPNYYHAPQPIIPSNPYEINMKPTPQQSQLNDETTQARNNNEGVNPYMR